MIAPSLIFGQIFYSLLTEKPTSTTDASILSQLAASLCFKEGSGDCRIYHADACSKRLAALHSALRAGCCTALKAELPNDAEFEEHAAICMKSVRSADPNSRLAQLVGHFRRLHQRTTFSRPPTTANERGDVCIGNTEFSIDIIHKLIPTVNKICSDAISSVIGDDRWREVLDPANRLKVFNADGTITFKLVYPSGSVVNGENIVPKSVVLEDELKVRDDDMMLPATIR